MIRNPSTAQPVVDPKTGLIKPEWLRFLLAIAALLNEIQRIEEAETGMPIEGGHF